MIVALPADMPATIPLVIPTGADRVLLLLHVPLPASLNIVVLPTHTDGMPDIR